MATGYSLHIGVRNPKQAIFGVGDSSGADRAATAMANIAEARHYSSPVVLVNEHATFARVTANFNAITSKLKDGDIFFMTLAGHGGQFDKPVDRNEPVNQAFFLYNHYWSDDEIYDALKTITAAARVIVVAEACFSASILTLLPQTFPDIADDNPRVRTGPILQGSAHPRPKLTANVLLLAASPENGLAPAAPNDLSVPPFTDALVQVWRDSDTYLDLCQQMTEILPSDSPEPILNPDLVTDRTFLDEAPFSI